MFSNPQAPGWWAATADGDGPGWETIFAGYGSTVDWPSASYYRQLAEAYPDAKVILTERDPEAWFQSTQETIFNQGHGPPRSSDIEAMINNVIGRMFDGKLNDRDRLIAGFRAHNAEVRRVIPAERLLVYFAADGWGPLCDFLEVPLPAEAMPNVNSTQEFKARFARA